jgi:NACalpha-BTF3-like transcription factor
MNLDFLDYINIDKMSGDNNDVQFDMSGLIDYLDSMTPAQRAEGERRQHERELSIVQSTTRFLDARTTTIDAMYHPFGPTSYLYERKRDNDLIRYIEADDPQSDDKKYIGDAFKLSETPANIPTYGCIGDAPHNYSLARSSRDYWRAESERADPDAESPYNKMMRVARMIFEFGDDMPKSDYEPDSEEATYDKDCIAIIIDQTNCSLDEATRAYKECNGDIINAIMLLAKQPDEIEEEK